MLAGVPLDLYYPYFFGFADHPWLAVDRTVSTTLYQAYADFEYISGGVCTDIDEVHSTNGGATWSSPTVVEDGCGTGTSPAIPQAVVGPNHELYVAWINFKAEPLIQVKRSTDGGVTFGPASVVATRNEYAGGKLYGEFLMQGMFRDLPEPSIAVDASSGSANNGAVYIAWNEGDNSVGDLFSGVYGYSNVNVSKSTDGGATWSMPVKVNDNANPASGSLGTDAFNPTIAVDETPHATYSTGGEIGVCWYDRRNDLHNYLIQRFCSVSTDGGSSWAANAQDSTLTFSSVAAQDVLVNSSYMGDYDQLTYDFAASTYSFNDVFSSNAAGNPDAVFTSYFY